MVTLDRYAAVDDVGKIMNRLLCEGQIHGGVAQGVGQALMEAIVFDDGGQLVTGSFQDYAMPRADDFPDLLSELTEVPATHQSARRQGRGRSRRHRRTARRHRRHPRRAHAARHRSHRHAGNAFARLGSDQGAPNKSRGGVISFRPREAGGMVIARKVGHLRSPLRANSRRDANKARCAGQNNGSSSRPIGNATRVSRNLLIASALFSWRQMDGKLQLGELSPAENRDLPVAASPAETRAVSNYWERMRVVACALPVRKSG